MRRVRPDEPDRARSRRDGEPDLCYQVRALASGLAASICGEHRRCYWARQARPRVPTLRARAPREMLALRQARAGRGADRPRPAMPVVLAGRAKRTACVPAAAVAGDARPRGSTASRCARRAAAPRTIKYCHDCGTEGITTGPEASAALAAR